MNGRPAIVHLDESSDGGSTRVRITLAWEDEHYSGEASGDGEEDLARLAGEATLRAVEAVTSGALHLELQSVATTAIGPARIALAHVRIRGSGDDLVGNALLGENDPALASVKAVLDAINRPLGRVI